MLVSYVSWKYEIVSRISKHLHADSHVTYDDLGQNMENEELNYLTDVPFSGIKYFAIRTDISRGRVNLKVKQIYSIINQTHIRLLISRKELAQINFKNWTAYSKEFSDKTIFWYGILIHTFCIKPKRNGWEDCSTHPSPSLAWWKSWQSFKMKKKPM